MKVEITTGGHTVAVESTEDDMSVHRLANIAVNTWRRTVRPEGEQCGPAYGFTSHTNAHSPFKPYTDWRLDEGRPLDAS